jgi:hypothetical protein
MAMSWYRKPGILPFDTRPGAEKPAGWYRFTAPPGFRAMTILARGQVQAWADGKEMRVNAAKPRNDDAREFSAALSEPATWPTVVALRIEQDRGAYGGEALPEPISLDCGPGETTLGDWTRQGVLECYSGGAWYRKTLPLTSEQARSRVMLDLGDLASSAELLVNGQSAGIRVCPPWKFDISRFVRSGDNRLEVLVLSGLGGHYATIPTRYRGSPASGLFGPVTMAVSAVRGAN